MNRRGFLRILGAGVAGVALEQAIPLGRVWSFPTEIVIPRPDLIARYLEPAAVQLAHYIDFAWLDYEKTVMVERDELNRFYLKPIRAPRPAFLRSSN